MKAVRTHWEIFITGTGLRFMVAPAPPVPSMIRLSSIKEGIVPALNFLMAAGVAGHILQNESPGPWAINCGTVALLEMDLTPNPMWWLVVYTFSRHILFTPADTGKGQILRPIPVLSSRTVNLFSEWLTEGGMGSAIVSKQTFRFCTANNGIGSRCLSIGVAMTRTMPGGSTTL